MMIFRRFIQLGILALFIAGNFYNFKILKGDLSASLLFNKIHLSDPLASLQLFLASFSISFDVLLGAIIVSIFYAFIAPRAFCGYVCPVNLVVDFSAFCRKKLRIKSNLINIKSNTRYFVLFFILLFSAIFGLSIFESFSQVSSLTRSIVFLNLGAFLGIFSIIFLIESLISPRLICSKLCPLGAFYAIISKFSLIRIFHEKENCTNCAKCKLVCPEPQVLSLIGKKSGKIPSECISCGRCVSACDDLALRFDIKERK